MSTNYASLGSTGHFPISADSSGVYNHAERQSKMPFVIIGIIMILTLVGYGIWIFVTHSKKIGFFKDYTPNIAASSGLVEPLKSRYANVYDKDQMARIQAHKTLLINAALAALAGTADEAALAAKASSTSS